MQNQKSKRKYEFLKRYKAFPNFISGFISVFTAGRNNSIYESLRNRTVEDGFRSDWENVGQDIQRAMNKFNELNK